MDELENRANYALNADEVKHGMEGKDGSGQFNAKGEVFRSMKINDTSKTPYSDATQVSNDFKMKLQ